MRLQNLKILVVFTAIFLISWGTFTNNWVTQNFNGYSLSYTARDNENIREYNVLIKNGILSVETFFNSPFKYGFEIYIHPDRHSLDSTWQKDWNMPEFKSECWMVASGVAAKMDIISPKLWDTIACEHIYSETKKTQQLITHELVHVYHGQLNISPDFSNVEGIDWFVEGLATFASGQCDSLRIAEVKNAIRENKIPNSIDKFWTGKIKYGLSGSLVMFIDYKYGRTKLKELLPLNKKSEVLLALKTTESELLDKWKEYIQNL